MIRLFLSALLLLPVLANANNQPRSCGLAYRMQQAELPQDIAVRVDRQTSGPTKIAMDWWAARLSTPAHAVTWHTVENLDDCMIYIRQGLYGSMPTRLARGYTYTPDHSKYSGVATVSLWNAWVVAHEIGHLIGCAHGAGVMRALHTPADERLWIDDDALHVALLVRIKASNGTVAQLRLSTLIGGL